MPGPTAAVPPEKLPNAFEAWLASKGIPERPKYYQRTLFVVKLMFLTMLSCDCVVKNLLLVSPTICSLNFHAVAKRCIDSFFTKRYKLIAMNVDHVSRIGKSLFIQTNPKQSIDRWSD
jgi:hypothetical protein